jgi:transcriptional antiterminator RfaH
MNWYAIYTKPKSEDIVSQKLRHAGIEVYGPKLRIKKYRSGRYCEVIEPLFPSYIFGQFEPDKHLWMISYTRGLKKVVGGTDGPWPVSEEVINLIRSHEQDGFVKLCSDEIKEGDTLRIADGPLTGLTGIFHQSIKGTERVILLLNAIGYQPKAIVERASLRKVS